MGAGAGGFLEQRRGVRFWAQWGPGTRGARLDREGAPFCGAGGGPGSGGQPPPPSSCRGSLGAKGDSRPRSDWIRRRGVCSGGRPPPPWVSVVWGVGGTRSPESQDFDFGSG